MPFLSSPSWIDHTLALLLVVGLPLLARRNYARLLAALQDGDRGVLTATFRQTVLRQTALGALLLANWRAAGRPLAGLGLGAPRGAGFVVGAALAALLIGYAGWQCLRVARQEQLQQQVRDRLAATSVGKLLPRSRSELRAFMVVAASAGTWEELLYRGFLVAYAGHWLGGLGGVLAAAAAFGIGHLYQGPSGVAKTGVAGLVAGALLWLTGSLWVPMLLHAAVDAHAGVLGWLAYGQGGGRPPTDADEGRHPLP